MLNLKKNLRQNWRRRSRRTMIIRKIVKEVRTRPKNANVMTTVLDAAPMLASVGVPIVVLSGTIPHKLLEPLCLHLNLVPDQSDMRSIDVVRSGDLLGSFPKGFRFKVQVVPHLTETAVHRVREIFDGKVPDFGIHIICASKQHASDVHRSLQKHSFCNSCLVTGDTSAEDLDAAAQLWSRGVSNVLVSTTAGLVGNESRSCRVVLVLGLLYDLMSVVQAMGRLRPLQRRSNGCIEFLVQTPSEEHLRRMRGADHVKSAELLRRGVLTEESLSSYELVGTRIGVHDWTFKDSGCRLVALGHRFGSTN